MDDIAQDDPFAAETVRNFSIYNRSLKKQTYEGLEVMTEDWIFYYAVLG